MTQSASRIARLVAASLCALVLFAANLPQASAAALTAESVVVRTGNYGNLSRFGSGARTALGDFNNDGFEDTALLTGYSHGPVLVFEGSATGLSGTAVDDTRIDGSSIAAGDFNGDGIDDLVVGNSLFNRAFVSYGSDSGLNLLGVITQRSPGVPGRDEGGDRFGWAVAAGDFDGDGFDDVAIGVPGEDIGDVENAGMVVVFRGAAAGLSGAGAKLLHQGKPGVAFTVEANDHFGLSLSTADFNGDGFADLVVGSPAEAVGDVGFAGAMHIFSGSPTGLSGDQSIGFSQRGPIPGVAQWSDHFGSAHASGDFDNDGYDDLVIGSGRESFLGAGAAGMITVVSGSATGIDLNKAYTIHQDSPGVPGVNQRSDYFGESIAIGDFDGDSLDDIAVGAPGDWVGSVQRRGTVTVLFGSATGVNGNADAVLLRSGRNTIPDLPSYVRDFGQAVVATDADNDGRVELIVGSNGNLIAVTWE